MRYAYDPELAPVVPLLPTIDLSDPVAAREQLRQLLDASVGMLESGLPDDVEWHECEVAGFEDDPPVPIRVYRPSASPPDTLPAVLRIHGGGFVLGSLREEHPFGVNTASQLPAVVVGVDYRLAPEHPFPCGLHDCYAALCWLHDNSGELGVDPNRVAVSGGSAGGGLAAALALFARDRGGPPICFQHLHIPELDDRLDTPSMKQFTDTPMWNRAQASASWAHYLGADRDGDTSPYAAPARAEDLAGLPPAHVSTMELDPLRDEGITYALRMLQAGVPVELHQFPGTFHGSELVAHAGVSQRSVGEMTDALRRALHPSG